MTHGAGHVFASSFAIFAGKGSWPRDCVFAIKDGVTALTIDENQRVIFGICYITTAYASAQDECLTLGQAAASGATRQFP
jgi:hypothetical protein